METKHAKLFLLFSALLCMAVLSCMGCADLLTSDQPKPVQLTISFLVTDSLTSSPVGGASVQLTIHSYGQKDRTVTLTTNASGATAAVSFESLSQTDRQTCDVTVTKDGYATTNLSITYSNNDKLTPYRVKLPPT